MMSYERGSDNGAIYHIRVKGSLDEKWADWFEGFAMMARANGETLLSGSLPDQAALHGVLGKIHGLGLSLLLVAKAECPCTSRNCPCRGKCRECAAKHAADGRLAYCFRERTKWDKRCAALVYEG
jgi:hypothetical protein